MRREGLVTRRPSKRLGAWTPADIPDLVLGLDNQLVTESGGSVTAWPGLWLPGIDLTQGTPSIQPTYEALDAAFPAPQPSVGFENDAARRLVGSVDITLAWFAVVAHYPATTFSGTPVLATVDNTAANSILLLGANTSANWTTSGGATMLGTRYRNGVATNVALNSADEPFLYEFVPTTPNPGSFCLGNYLAGPLAGLAWRGRVALVLGASSVPDAQTRAALLAYCQGRGMIP